ncbi:MAG: tetratricopeptide repeat protein, partial [Patescibacteria group bacterium]
HPVLGWGQENFTYVFQKYYRPEMYNLEPWFDRAHNVFLDWAIAGGLLSLFIYLSLYFFALSSIWQKGNFSYIEKSVLTSLLAAYFFHNIFVFDHLFSYVLFLSLLAYLHGRSQGELLWNKNISYQMTQKVLLPVFTIILVFSLYFINWKPLNGNLSLIEVLKALNAGQVGSAITNFEKAYAASPLGRSETIEQITSNTNAILSSTASMEEKNRFYAFAHKSILEQAQAAPSDARTQIVVGSFLSLTGSLDEALQYLNRARELAPNKTEAYFEIGAAYLNKNEPVKALEYFHKAYELAPKFSRAQSVYLAGAIYSGNRALENELLSLFNEKGIIFDDTVLNAYYSQKRFAEVIRTLERRKQLDPVNAATYDNYIEQIKNQK